jgi:hypothetical protein
MPPTIYFHEAVRICGNKYIITLRTTELCICNSVSISGGQSIMYQQLMLKR